MPSSTGATRRPSRRPATCARSKRSSREIGVGELVSAIGRYYAMDRDKRWERLEIAWKMLTRGEGTLVDDLAAAVEKGYTAGPDGKELTDEFVLPLVRKGPDGKARSIIKDGDACFFYNFRADRARQLTLALHAGDGEFPYFDRGKRPKLAGFATMTQYDSKVDVPVAFPPQSLSMILGEVLSKHGVSQLRTAETEKYPHVTYFFNGGNEQAFPGEERKLIPSNRDVATYDLAPEMSAAPVTDGVVEALKPGGPTFILVNYANPDMVGHTGKLEPAIHAIETVDKAMGRIVEAAAKVDATVYITADHGNCETMIDPPDRAAPHRAYDEPHPVHRHRQAAGRAQAAPGRAAGRRRADHPRRDGNRRAGGDGRREPLRPRRPRRKMSIGKRLIDSGALRAELVARQGGARRRRRGRRPGTPALRLRVRGRCPTRSSTRRSSVGGRRARRSSRPPTATTGPRRVRRHASRRRRRRGARPRETRRSGGPTRRWRCRPARIWRRSNVPTGG